MKKSSATLRNGWQSWNPKDPALLIPPGGPFLSDGDLQAYRMAAEKADILIAEVGAWGGKSILLQNHVAEEGYGVSAGTWLAAHVLSLQREMHK